MGGVKSSNSLTIKTRKYSLVKFPSTQAVLPTIISPLQISGLKAWYETDSVKGLVDGSTFGQWADLSGNGNHLTTAAGTVTIKTNILNGKPVIRFTGTQRMQRANILNSKTTVSIFFVAIPRDTKWNIPLAQDINTSDLTYESTSNLDGHFYINNAGGAVGPAPSVINTAEVTSLLANGIQLQQWRNGVAGPAVNQTGNTGTNVFAVGGRSNGTFFTTSDWAEILIFDRCVTPTERRSIENYLFDKYGFPLNY